MNKKIKIIILAIVILVSIIDIVFLVNKIINIGIKQDGITSIIPVQITTKELEALSVISNDKKILDYYTKDDSLYKLNKKYNKKELEEKLLFAESFYNTLRTSKVFKYDINKITLNYYLKLDENNPVKELYEKEKKKSESELRTGAIEFIKFENKKTNYKSNKNKYITLRIITIIVLCILIVLISLYLKRIIK